MKLKRFISKYGFKYLTTAAQMLLYFALRMHYSDWLGSLTQDFWTWFWRSIVLLIFAICIVEVVASAMRTVYRDWKRA